MTSQTAANAVPLGSPPRPSILGATAPIPLGLARTALFGVGTCSAATVNRQEILCEADPLGLRIFYSGPVLNQAHSLAWCAVLQVARERRTAPDEPFVVPANHLLKAMGCHTDDYKQRQRLWRLIEDLSGARVDLKSKRQSYTGTLVFEAKRDKATGYMSILLNPTLAGLLADEVLINDLERKTCLGKDNLAMWLHDYLATHKTPPPVSVDRLRQLSGSPLKLPQFRQRLRRSLERLAATPSPASGVPLLLSWSIDARDRLCVQKSATKVILIPAAKPSAVAPAAASPRRYNAYNNGRTSIHVAQAAQMSRTGGVAL